MALHAIGLVMTVRAVEGSGLGRTPVIQGPDRPMRPDAWKGDVLIKFFVMAVEAVFFGRENLLISLLVAIKAGGIFIKKQLVFIVIELDRQDRACHKSQGKCCSKYNAAYHNLSPIKN
jgi:hypothetical protein